jgi:hypothetical protein
MKLRDVWRLLVCLEYCGAGGLLKVRLKQCLRVQGVGLCVHVYLCTGCSKIEELSVHVFISVQGVLNVEKLSVH